MLEGRQDGYALITVETDVGVQEASTHYFLCLCLFLIFWSNKHFFKMFTVLKSAFRVIHYTILFASVFIKFS